ADPDEGLYLLKVDLHQAEQIYHVVQVAPDSFSLALRPGEDTRAADTTQYGETTDRLIMTYLFPVPQLIDLSALLGVPVSPGQGGATPSQSPGTSPSPGPGETSSPETTPAPDGTPAPPPL
ncbi:MAG: hypothetical protein ACXWZL_13140, partial [Mycobacterium sp.]